MARSLVIVESPAKAKTINKYLGRNYTVKASIGHVMDLPTKTIGIRLPGEDPAGNKKAKKKKGANKSARAEAKPPKISINDEKVCEPTLQIISGKGKVIHDLRRAAHSAEAVYLAPDPDREGEAISAHLAMVLSKPSRFVEAEAPGRQNGKGAEAREEANSKAAKRAANDEKLATDIPPADPKKIFRVTFNEITPKAIRAAFEHPRGLDTNLVEAQQARRVLDRLVGYKISPLLWNKVRRGLSAGRVQTVALRLIVEREEAIRAFVAQEYWTIHAMLDAGKPPLFEAKLIKHKDEDIEVKNREAAEKIVAAVGPAKWQVTSVAQKEKKRNPPPPFTTSKLQQAAYNRLRYTAKRTMSLAQKLYEGVELGSEGSVALITYMRTDSVHVSNDALEQVRELIPQRFGAEIRWLPSGLSVAGVGRGSRRRREGRGRRGPESARGCRGSVAAAGQDSSRPALHRAAAALQRRDAGERARRGRHRPPLDLRRHYFDAARERVRHEGSRPFFADHAWRARMQAPGKKLRRHFRSQIHRADGGRTRRNRRGQAAVARVRERVLGKVRPRPRQGRLRNALLQSRHSYGKKMREMRAGRTARTHQPPRLLPGLLALSRVRLHRRPFAR